MPVHPILAALRHHKSGVFLIVAQIALTLAIVCNVIFIVGQRVGRIHRPTGLDEHNLFLIMQQYVGAPSGDDPEALQKLDSMQLTDLAALRALPDVQYATPVNSLPLLRWNWIEDVSLKPGQQHGMTRFTMFTGGQQMLKTLGLHLIAGRDFTAADIRHRSSLGKISPPVVIVTRALADKLFPDGDAVGKAIYINSDTAPSMIVGEVARMLTSDADGEDSIAWYSVLVPARNDASSTQYAVRAKPGRLQAAMHAAREKLFATDPMRVIQNEGRYSPQGIHTFAQIRDMGYALDGFMAHILIAICMVLLVITGVGMAGLTSFWVSQRHKQIGVRRALGARRIDILRYFQIENLLIAGGGCIAGIVLAVGLNLTLMRLFAMARLPGSYELMGVVAVLALGQLAAFMPALRAAAVPPVVATRTV